MYDIIGDVHGYATLLKKLLLQMGYSKTESGYLHPLRKAVFVDRDGTINEESGYLFRKEECRFIPGALGAVVHLNKAGFLVVVITNQSGIGKGVFDLDRYRSFEREYNALLNREGIDIIETYCCPHRKDQPCICRKPSPHFMTAAAAPPEDPPAMRVRSQGLRV